jgi:hypothetical protein
MKPGGESASDERFSELLSSLWTEHVERHEHVVFGLLPDLTLGYMNPAWFRFARDNGSEEILDRWGLGSNVIDAISGPLRRLFEREYRRCFDEASAWQHDYECSSASRFREYHMDAFPLEAGRGLLVINSLTEDRPHGAERVARPPLESLYTNDDGLILQCGYCRRIQRVDGSETWDWVPEWIRSQPDNVTGGLCTACYLSRFGH